MYGELLINKLEHKEASVSRHKKRCGMKFDRSTQHLKHFDLNV